VVVVVVLVVVVVVFGVVVIVVNAAVVAPVAVVVVAGDVEAALGPIWKCHLLDSLVVVKVVGPAAGTAWPQVARHCEKQLGPGVTGAPEVVAAAVVEVEVE
jgi:hypothetical protein